MKKFLYTLGGVLALFIITNPSATAFKEHLGRNTYQGLIRERNYIVFSTYEDKLTHLRYEAVLDNFFEYREPEIREDSTKVGDPYAKFGGPIVKDEYGIPIRKTK